MIMGKNKEDLRDLRDIYEERIRGCGISMALDIKWKKKTQMWTPRFLFEHVNGAMDRDRKHSW